MEIRWEGTLIEKFPALISAHKKSKKKKPTVCLSWVLAIRKNKKKEKSDSAIRGKEMTKGDCPKSRKGGKFLIGEI